MKFSNSFKKLEVQNQNDFSSEKHAIFAFQLEFLRHNSQNHMILVWRSKQIFIMVFESLVAELMNRYLGEYIENLDYSQLNIGIWGGMMPVEYFLASHSNSEAGNLLTGVTSILSL